MANIYRSITTGVVALATSGITLSFAAAAQATGGTLSGTLSITGNATISPWGTANPVLTPLDVNGVTIATGQFAGVSITDIIQIPLPFTLSGTGTGGFTVFGNPPDSPGFIKIDITAPPGPGLEVGDAVPTLAQGTNFGGSTVYNVIGTMVFDEPTGPDFIGSFNIAFVRSVDLLGAVSQGYILSLQKTGERAHIVGVPEPSAVLGMLALGLTGVLARRQKG